MAISTPKAKERLVLATEHRNYQCLTMPLGSTGVLGTFAKVICLAFRELLDIIASYFNDVTVYSKYLNYHLSHLKQAF